MRHSLGSKRGFTLLEFMVVIVIVGIMVVATVPRISQSMGGTRVNRAAGIVALDMELAMSHAARLRQPVRITVTPGTLEYSITNRATSAVLLRRTFGSDTEYQLSGMTSSPATVDVFPTGLLSQALTLRVTGAGRTRQITVSRAGQVRTT
jgi:prepilin-type N-terminal cleavage/methylation domain-containing protein